MTPEETAKFIFGRDMKPCKECGSYNIRIRTPIEDDWTICRTYIQCLACGYKDKELSVDYEVPPDYFNHSPALLNKLCHNWNYRR